MTDSSFADLYPHFAQRLEAVAGTVAQADGIDELAAAISTRVRKADGEPAVIWIAAETAEIAPRVLAALTRQGFVPRIATDPAAVRDQPLGLTIARATIAETGSSLLVEPTVEGRSVTLMTVALIVLCEKANLVPGLTEAAPILREVSASGASYATFVTGPSRTSDIERTLTIGVQGPSEFHVFFTDEIG
jgi:L-lactate dehydrogenase complex protein LldG